MSEMIFGNRAGITEAVLYNGTISGTSSAVVNTTIDITDDITNYDYLLIECAWRNGGQKRQYILKTSLITIRDNNSNTHDYMFDYGYNNTNDYIALSFLKNKKVNVYIAGVTNPYSVALNKIIGIKF